MPWGEDRNPKGTLPTTVKYTGQQEEAGIGLYYYKARWYDSALGRFAQADSIVPNPGNPLDWDRYQYGRSNPLIYTDPSGHNPLLLAAILFIGAIILTNDSPIAPPPTYYGNAETVGDLMQLGIGQADHANITGEGLRSLQNDPSVEAAQTRITEQIRSEPPYGQRAFSLEDGYGRTSFTANGASGDWRQAAFEGNQAFYMVHTGELSATNTRVSADGTIQTTWRVDDQFDYLPAWDDHRRSGRNYWAYNGYAQIVAPIYHGLLRAPQYPTTATWNETIPPLAE